MRLTALDDAAWDSPWRRIRVGEKVWLSLGLVVTALATPAWPGSLLVFAVAAIATLGFARIPARVLGLALAAPGAFIVVGAVSIAFQVGDTPVDALWGWGPLWLSHASLERAAVVTGHALAGTCAILLLATTTPMVDLLTWLRRMRVPGPLIEIASLTYRLLFVLLATTFAVFEASAARLGDAPLGTGRLRRRFANAAAGIGAVMLRTWDRTTRLQHGLEARGLDGELRVMQATATASPAMIALTTITLAGIWTTCGVLA